MLTIKDIHQLQDSGIGVSQIEHQLEIFSHGIPHLHISGACSIQNGIFQYSKLEMQKYITLWDQYLADSAHKVVKFVPASGVASRMFKELYEFIKTEDTTNEIVALFFLNIEKFAFYELLDENCRRKTDDNLEQLIISGYLSDVLKILLEPDGMNYGNMPKGLLPFHQYINEIRTPFLEHLVEGVLYVKDVENNVRIHFTVSGEHKSLFEKHLLANKSLYEKRYNVIFHITFSEQKKSTDTIAVDENNNPFRQDDGSLLLRPAGHGALIENLNEIDAAIIFIKNIDNIVPDHKKEITTEYKKLIAGVLLNLQQQTFTYLKELENHNISDAKLQVISQFSHTRLCNHHPNISTLGGKELKDYLISKLNRPIRVCGMVKNQGEPGGGPYMVYNPDGTLSPQILESSQINTNDKREKKLMSEATHFNPVDLVCGVKNYKNEKFNLLNYIDPNTCFISLKSKNGKELKALELPGLWNGAMSDWNTIFVEVPIETFNPVKNVTDLLREEHQ